jgi:predicted transcriptional regulator
MTGSALLLSIKPRFADAIFSRQKRVELRRVSPRVGSGDLVLIYVTSPRCALEGAFEVERVLEARPSVLWSHVAQNAGVSHEEFNEYFGDRAKAYAIVIRRVWRLSPVSLSAMRKAKVRPPQSYQYLNQSAMSRLTSGGYKSRGRLDDHHDSG